MKNILDLNEIEARNFFLKQESFFNFDLPHYFAFESLLNDISQKIEGNDIEAYYKNFNQTKNKPLKPFPSELEGVNYILLNNKNGKYAWRPLQLIHPALYVALVHKITGKDNWEHIVDKFQKFQDNPKIRCQSIPVV